MNRKPIKFSNNPLFGGPSLESRAVSGSPYRELSISEIDVDPDQPRRVFGEESLNELASSIKEHGVLCPVLVRVSEGGTFRLVAGERRLRAAKLAGLERIPAVIDSSGDNEGKRLAKQLVENVQRENLSAMERALAVGQLKDQTGWSIREIASQLGVSKGYVQRSLEVLQLPDDMQAALIAGASESKVTILAKLSSKEQRAILLARIDQLSRSELEAEVQLIINGTPEKSKLYHRGTVKNIDSSDSERVEDNRISEDIQRSIGCKVSISRLKNKPERGKVIIEFYSDDDLSELYKRLCSSK